MNKKEALAILNRKLKLDLNHQNTVFSNPGSTLDLWWLEPANAKFQSGFYFILHNKHSKQLHVFKVPGKSLRPSQFRQRPEKDVSQIIIPISNNRFRDRNGADLTRYHIKSASY